MAKKWQSSPHMSAPHSQCVSFQSVQTNLGRISVDLSLLVCDLRQASDWHRPRHRLARTRRALSTIMERALLHNGQNRFQTSVEFRDALEAAIIR